MGKNYDQYSATNGIEMIYPSVKVARESVRTRSCDHRGLYL
jgi:hypothetical protein